MTISRSDAARAMGSVKSEKKTAAARQNSKKAGRPTRPLSDFPCNCGRGDAIEGHGSLCPRGRKIKRLQEAGKPLQ